MPHLIIEHSPNLHHCADPQAVCLAAYEALRDAGIFPIAGIRVRAHRAEHSIVAGRLPQNAFVAMTLSVGAGRAEAGLETAGGGGVGGGQGGAVRPPAARAPPPPPRWGPPGRARSGGPVGVRMIPF